MSAVPTILLLICSNVSSICFCMPMRASMGLLPNPIRSPVKRFGVLLALRVSDCGISDLP